MAIFLKCRSIHGKNISLRRVRVEDAGFILSLRLSPIKSRYISSTSSDLCLQETWIQESLLKDNEILFIIESREGKKLGCIRMYDSNSESYTWGSWLMVDGLSPGVAIESIALLYSYGKILGYQCAKLDVRKKNVSVWNFHEKYTGAKLVSEDELDRFYLLDEMAINVFLSRHTHLLTEPLRIFELGSI
jgi:hypothetical protein